MERCEPPRTRRAGARRRRRRRPLADWQLRDIARVASQHRAAGYHAVKVHGVLIVFRHTREVQHAGDGRGHQRTVGDAPTASSAKPEQLSKRKQRSSMRLADFRRRMEQRDQAAASKLRRLWSVVWLQRLVRRRLGERSRLAAGVAIVGEPGADAGLQKAKADASEACVAPVGSAATFRAAAVAAPKRKVGSGAEVSPAKAVARLGALSTSPAARPEAAEMVVAAAAAGVAAAAGSAAEGKRRVDFGAPVPPSKRGWTDSGGGAIGGGGAGGGGGGGGSERLSRSRPVGEYGRCTRTYKLYKPYTNRSFRIYRTTRQLRIHFQGRGPSRTRRNLLTLVLLKYRHFTQPNPSTGKRAPLSDERPATITVATFLHAIAGQY